MNRARPAAELSRRIGGTRRWILLSALLGTVTVGSGIALVAMSTHLVTMSEIYGTAATLSLVILAVRASAVTRVVARYVDRYLGHLGTFRVLTRLRVWTYSSLVDAEPLGDADHRRGDVVAALVDDVETMQDHLLRVAVPVVVTALTSLIGAVVIALIDPAASLVFLGVFTVVAVVSWSTLRRAAATAGRAMTAVRAERLARSTEELAVLDEMIAWGRADRLTAVLSELDDRERPATRRLAAVRARADAVVTLTTGGTALVLAAMVLRPPFTVDVATWVLAVPVLALAATEAIGPLLAGAERSASTDAAAGRVLDLVERHRPPPRPPSRPLATRSPRLVLDHVSFAFDGGPIILEHDTTVVEWGHTVVVVAPSGTGKSTLGELLLGLRSPTGGAVRIDDIDVRAIDHEDRPTLMAAVLQDDHLFDTTLRDNLLVADADADDECLRRFVTVAGLDALVDERSLDLPVGPDGASLSGGERQRVLLARAMVADAPILVLDEAGEHLDPERRRQVLDAVLDSRRGRTTIVLAHDTSVIARADRVLELRDGRLHEHPRHEHRADAGPTTQS